MLFREVSRGLSASLSPTHCFPVDSSWNMHVQSAQSRIECLILKLSSFIQIKYPMERPFPPTGQPTVLSGALGNLVAF